MTEACVVSAKKKRITVGSAKPAMNIDSICQECSERENAPEAFLLSNTSFGNSLLAVSTFFLEDGQLLNCPGLPLVGAVFDPDWGFSRAELKQRHGSRAEFRVPSGHPDTFTSGSTWGYRLCPIDNSEIPDLIKQLVHIRTELARPRKQPNAKAGLKSTVTEL